MALGWFCSQPAVCCECLKIRFVQLTLTFFVGRLRYFLILLRNFGGFRMCNEKEYLHILLDVVLSGIFFAWSLVFLFWPMRMYWFLWNFGRLIPPYGQQQDSVELLRGPESIEIYHLKSKNGINNEYMIMKIGFDVGYWLYLPLLGAFLFHTAHNDVQFLANLDLPQQEVVHWNGMKYEFLWPNRSL